MKVFRIQRGKYKGRIDVPRSMDTMEVGEKWLINPDDAVMQSVRNKVSIANQGDKRFEAHCPAYDEPFISIIRMK